MMVAIFPDKLVRTALAHSMHGGGSSDIEDPVQCPMHEILAPRCPDAGGMMQMLYT